MPLLWHPQEGARLRWQGTPAFGRGDRIRTRDLRFWRPPLYQLSYTPARGKQFTAKGRAQTSAFNRAITSSIFIGPRSPCSRCRTPTVPASISLSPQISM